MLYLTYILTRAQFPVNSRGFECFLLGEMHFENTLKQKNMTNEIHCNFRILKGCFVKHINVESCHLLYSDVIILSVQVPNLCNVVIWHFHIDLIPQ